ncbi:hypothetical protein C8R42DRAFT_687052 [Lentinula raphanica]|nr:hypothetical protein C8R42DRAFT_687052 [Lentinula raphanica]
MSCLMNIGGSIALLMFDSGSSLEALTPMFTQVAKHKVFELKHQHSPPVAPQLHSLQLGTVGSRAKFNYGTYADVVVGNDKYPTYWDIINLDRYDAMIGTYWMRKHNVVLDFKNNIININGCKIATMTATEDAAEFQRRVAMHHSKRNEKLKRKDNPSPKESTI